MKVIVSRSMYGTVYRKKKDEKGNSLYTKEVDIDREEFLEVERVYQKRIGRCRKVASRV